MNGLGDISIRQYFRLALACGLLPLVSGVSVLLLFVLTHHDGLPVVGLMILIAGPVLLVAGLVSLCVGLLRMSPERIAAANSQRGMPVQWLAVIALLVLLVNPPAGVICAAIGERETTRYIVHVHNTTTQTIGPIDLAYDGKHRTLNAVRPGGRESEWFMVVHDGDVTMTLPEADGPKTYTLASLSSQTGGHVYVTLLEGQPPRIVYDP